MKFLSMPFAPWTLRALKPAIKLAILFQLMLLLIACDKTGEDSKLDPTKECTIGTGSLVFEPLLDGAMVPIISGPQGGYHVWGSLRATGIDPGDYYNLNDPDNPQTQFDVYLDDGTRIGGTAQLRAGLKVREDGTLEYVGEPIILAIRDPLELAGQSGQIVVGIEDSNGFKLSDQVEIIFAAAATKK